MKQSDLVVGQKYILDTKGRPVATYEGKHEGVVTLNDGAIFVGYSGWLKFRTTGDEPQVILIETGRDIREPAETRDERLRLEAESYARREAALKEATAFVEFLGLETSEDRFVGKLTRKIHLDGRDEENADNIPLINFTVGHLRQLFDNYDNQKGN